MESAKQAQASNDVQTQLAPCRGSFQDDAVDIPTILSDHDRVRPEDEASQTIHVVNIDAVASNARQPIISHIIDADDDAMFTDDDLGFAKSSSGSPRPSNALSTSAQPPLHLDPSRSSEDSVVEVGHSAYQLPSDPGAKSGKLRNKYVMPDGSVVNGKGLGRGRPGIKRGPRKSALSNEITNTADGEFIATTTPSPSPQIRPFSGKRKRTESNTDPDPDPDPSDTRDDEEDESTLSSRESTPEYNPAASTQTRSGRQSQKPISITASSSGSGKATTKRPSLVHNTSSPSIKKHPKIKPKVYRGREQFALCEHCLRGNGPPGNVIVFCDACNKCWHQRCHDPKISKEIVADTKAEWFCSDCDRILHGKKKQKPPPKPTPQPVQAVAVPLPPPSTHNSMGTNPIGLKPQYGMPYIPGMALTLAQRKQYLNSLPKEKLIEIVLRAAELAPNMPIFESPLHEAPQMPLFAHQPPPPHQPHQPPYHPSHHPHHPPVLHNQFPFATLPRSMRPPPPSTFPAQPPQQPLPMATPPPAAPSTPPIAPIPVFSHPTAGTPSKPNTVPPPLNADDDEGYYDNYDELALVYAKPGEGVYDLVLPPESADLNMLLEGPESRTFSHWVRGRGDIRRSVEGAR